MALDGIPLVGGLDLVSHDQNSRSGALRKCSNFERSTIDGYAKIDGFHGIDGVVNDMQMAFARAQFVRATYSPPAPGTTATYVVGTQYFINNIPSICIYSEIEAMVDGIAISDVEQTLFVSISEILVPAISDATISIVDETGTQIEEPDSFVMAPSSDDFWGDVSYSTLSSAISALEQYWLQLATVPSGQGQVYGLHFFKNQQYAIREYRSLLVTSDAFTDTGLIPLNGETISTQDGGWTAEVVKAYADDGSWGRGDEECRILIRNEQGTVAIADAIGYPGAVVGMLLTGYPMGIAPLGADIGTGFTSFSELASVDAESEGCLWVATSSGWREVDMLREVPFRTGTIMPDQAVRLAKAIDAASLTATNGTLATATKINLALSASATVLPATYADTVGYVADVNTANYVDVETSAATTDITFVFRGFDFSMIPDSATILGVEVLSSRRMANSTGSDYFKELEVRLVGAGTSSVRITAYAGGIGIGPGELYAGMRCTSQDKSDRASLLPTSFANRTYGGLRDLWGATEIKSSEVRDSENFGVWIQHRGIEAGNTPNLQIAYIRMTVFYQQEDGRTYAINATGTPDPNEVRIVNISTTSGDWTTGDAAGVATIICDKDIDKSRLFADGDLVWENDDNSGDQYFTLAGPDYPVTMPGRDTMDAAKKQFEFITENFYASARWNAFYGVTGVSPAFCYDGTFFVRIRTELLNDTPSCISRHHNLLVLGFDDGISAFSAQGDPLNFVATNDAFVREFGSPVTNMTKLVSDTLGVFCRDSIHAAVGTDSSLQTRIISPVTGAFPYTVRNVSGRTIGVDNWGEFVVDTTERFGDFVNGRLSKAISPFLIKRTQERGQFPEIRPRFAYLCRAKNQYRVVFGDGKQITATFTPEGLPEFTMQEFPYAPVCASSDVDSQGRERIAMSFDYSGNQSNYLEESVVVDDGIEEFPVTDGKVVAMDSGHTFDGYAITGHIEVSTNDNGSPLALKKSSRLVVYGQSEGSVDVTVSHSVNNGPMVEFGDFPFNPSTVNASDDMIPASMVVPAEADYFSHAFRLEVTGVGKVVFQYMIDDNNGIAKTQGNLERGR